MLLFLCSLAFVSIHFDLNNSNMAHKFLVKACARDYLAFAQRKLACCVIFPNGVHRMFKNAISSAFYWFAFHCSYTARNVAYRDKVIRIFYNKKEDRKHKQLQEIYVWLSVKQEIYELLKIFEYRHNLTR